MIAKAKSWNRWWPQVGFAGHARSLRFCRAPRHASQAFRLGDTKEVQALMPSLHWQWLMHRMAAESVARDCAQLTESVAESLTGSMAENCIHDVTLE